MTLRPVAVFVLWAGGGYAVAVVVAVAVAVFFMALPTVFPDQGMWGSFHQFVLDLPGLYVLGCMITTIFGLPGFLIAVVLAARSGWNSWRPFAAAGAANAVLALILYHAYVGGPIMPAGVLLPCLPGGAAGGYAYWLVAGRHLRTRWPAA